MDNSEIFRRVYLTCPAAWLPKERPVRDFDQVKKIVFDKLDLRFDDSNEAEVVGVPSQDFKPYFGEHKPPEPPAPEREVVQFLFTSQSLLDSFLARVEERRLADPENGPQAGADVPFSVSDYVDYWCPAGAGASFGTRAAAIRQRARSSLKPSAFAVSDRGS